MKLYLYILICVIAASCSELTVENEPEYPATDELTPTTIDTQFGVVNIFAEQEDLDRMFRYYREDILIDAYIDWYRRGTRELILDSLPTKLEIKGQGSTEYPLKSLGFIFNGEVDNSQRQILDPPQVLERHTLDTLKSLRLRNSGNDFYGTMFKDLAYTQMALEKNLDFEFMYGEPVHAFINGDYYGLLNIRTESNEQGISRLLGVETEHITLMEVDDDNENLEHRAGSQELAQRVVTAIQQRDTEALWELIDISSYIDYIIYEDYVGNNDWPGRNAKAYSLNGQPFRFFLYDLDRAADIPRNPVLPELEYLDADLAKIYRALDKRPEFSKMLKKRQAEIYKMFSPAIFEEITDRFAQRIENDIDYNIGKYNLPDSKLHWRLNIEEIRRDFEVQDNHARGKYDL